MVSTFVGELPSTLRSTPLQRLGYRLPGDLRPGCGGSFWGKGASRCVPRRYAWHWMVREIVENARQGESIGRLQQFFSPTFTPSSTDSFNAFQQFLSP
jgi:hypothetical protein